MHIVIPFLASKEPFVIAEPFSTHAGR
ncbi:uncharacterized protein METZ01_LOCUS500593 [marine metagenome]|uniref:Uncharacterized protein n=1 Tax=marine metagenome TaxID=408172 RepID=A0A383DTV9_9ZZZZ